MHFAMDSPYGFSHFGVLNYGKPYVTQHIGLNYCVVRYKERYEIKHLISVCKSVRDSSWFT